MYRVPIEFYNRLDRGEIPIAYILISTHMGDRAYAEKELGKAFDVLGYIADGSYDADGSILAGSESMGVIEKSARVVSLGSFGRTLNPKKDDVLIALESKQVQHTFVELDNTDRYFSKLIAKEPFISRDINIYVGFEAEPFSTHLSVFKGTITELSILPILTIEADER